MFSSKQNILTYLIQNRPFSFSCLCQKSHYETLGVSPNATFADIKKAYYNLSMLYHPDKSDGSPENLEKFRAVTEAYEVLANLKSKKLYDKGVLRKAPVKRSSSPSSKAKPVYVPEDIGRSPIYNFEEWSRAHYGVNIARRAAAKERYNTTVAFNKKNQEVNAQTSAVVTCVSILFIVAFFLNHFQEDWDKPDQSINKNKPN